jgi:hypothetical protein
MNRVATLGLLALLGFLCMPAWAAPGETERGFVRMVAGSAVLVDASEYERLYLEAGHQLAPGDGLFVQHRSVVEVLFGDRARLIAAADTQLWRAPVDGPVDLELGVGRMVVVTGPADAAIVNTGNARVTLEPGTRVAVTRSLDGDDRVAVAEGRATVDTPDCTFVLTPGYAAWALDGTSWRSGRYSSWRKGAWALAPGWRVGRRGVLVRMAEPDWDSAWLLTGMTPAWENPRYIEAWTSCYAWYGGDHCLDQYLLDYYRWYELHGHGATPGGEDEEEDDGTADGGTKELPEGPHGPEVSPGPGSDPPPATVEVRTVRGRSFVDLTCHREVEEGLYPTAAWERYEQHPSSRQRAVPRGRGGASSDDWMREGVGSSSWSSTGSGSSDRSSSSVRSVPAGTRPPSRSRSTGRSSSSKKKSD